jgi:hypothetical protein
MEKGKSIGIEEVELAMHGGWRDDNSRKDE